MRAVLAGEDADRQPEAGERAALREIDVGLLVRFDLPGLAVELPDDVVAFVGPIEMAVLADIRIVGSGSVSGSTAVLSA